MQELGAHLPCTLTDRETEAWQGKVPESCDSKKPHTALVHGREKPGGPLPQAPEVVVMDYCLSF
jgi:hypothetical protein